MPVSAADASKALANELYQLGCYVGLQSPGTTPLLATTAAATHDVKINPEALSGLVVQAIGYEKGESNPRLHLYALRASKKIRKLIPKEIAGFELVTHSMGRVYVMSPLPAALGGQGNIFQRGGRIACGSSCAPAGEQIAGTMGLLARIGDEMFCLSNNHVLSACNHVDVGMPIMAPAVGDARPGFRAPEQIATHHDFVELRSGIPAIVPPNTCDLGRGRITDPGKVSSWQGDGTGYDTPAAIGIATAGMQVRKQGRTTGDSIGNLQSFINTFTSLPYSFPKFRGNVWFTDFWVVEKKTGAFALPGDSGSLVVNQDASEAVGMVFAATAGGDFGLMMPATTIRDAYDDFELVTGHNINE